VIFDREGSSDNLEKRSAAEVVREGEVVDGSTCWEAEKSEDGSVWKKRKRANRRTHENDLERREVELFVRTTQRRKVRRKAHLDLLIPLQQFSELEKQEISIDTTLVNLKQRAKAGSVLPPLLTQRRNQARLTSSTITWLTPSKFPSPPALSLLSNTPVVQNSSLVSLPALLSPRIAYPTSPEALSTSSKRSEATRAATPRADTRRG